jgi:uncharacterized protein (DUF1501 family)
LAVVANVGSLVQPLTRAQYQSQQAPIPLNLFSHSDQQLQWQTALAQGHSPTGWAGRAADYIAGAGFNTGNFPVFVSVAGNALEGAGVQTQPAAITPGQALGLVGSQSRLSALKSLLTTDTGVSLVQAANNTLANGISDAKALEAALAKASPLNELATHNNLYPQLSPALAAFYDATQELGVAQNVTTFTESDFSRTFQPTTDDGSDHAWGSHHLVLGGAVQGGQIFGKFPTFQLAGPDDADVRGRWIPTTSIDQYGATLCSWFGIPDASLATVFPNFQNFGSVKLGFLG